jgi:hypothetical protein
VSVIVTSHGLGMNLYVYSALPVLKILVQLFDPTLSCDTSVTQPTT